MVGNKQDVVREIEPGDVQDWAQNFLPQERYKKEVICHFNIIQMQPFT